MTSRPARSGEPTSPQVVVLHGDAACDVFEVVGLDGVVLQVRSAYLFELGEELRIQIVRDGAIRVARAQVRAHRGPRDRIITELELVDEPGRDGSDE